MIISKYNVFNVNCRGNSAAEKYTGYAINKKASELAKQVDL